MSTRATVHFVDASTGQTQAIIYRHSDGYPEGLGEDLKKFLKDLKKNLPDNRLGDPNYLAAKWVVYDARRHQRSNAKIARILGHKPKRQHPLDFLSVGVCLCDPGDIDFRYKVMCGAGNIPEIKVEEV